MHSFILKKSYELKKTIILVISFTFLMVLASYARIHLFFTPVPVTFQTFVVFLSLVLLKSKSYIPQMFYLVIGACGIPVFGNGGAGIVYMLGPTGGYLMGFLIAAFIAGIVMRRLSGIIKKHLLGYIVIFSLVNAIIYIFGFIWLVGVYGVSFPYALSAGIVPFIIPDSIKIVLAACLSYKLIKQ